MNVSKVLGFIKHTSPDAGWMIVVWLLLNGSTTVQGIQYFLHHHCNRTLSLGPSEVGQVRITQEMPDKAFRPRIADCEVQLATAFDDERIRLAQRVVDKRRYETGKITIINDDSDVSLPTTSTGRKITLRFETEDIENIFVVEVTIDFAVIGDPWLLQEQIGVNRALLITILVLLIVMQLVILFKLCKAERRYAEEANAESPNAPKNNKDNKKGGNVKGSSGKPSSPSSMSSAMKIKRDFYGSPDSPNLNRIPQMDTSYKKAAMGVHEDKEDNYYIKGPVTLKPGVSEASVRSRSH